MTLKHNKKRNSGMLCDFFSAYIAECVVNKDYARVAAANKIWGMHVRPNTELYKEIGLHESIRNCNIGNEKVIHDFMSSVKRKALKINTKKLDEEKTNLIRAINENLKDNMFFSRPIKNYTELATVQIWLNIHASRKTLSESYVNPAFAELEDRIFDVISGKKLLKNSNNNPELTKTKLEEVLNMNESDVDRLVVNIMREKFNTKLNEQFNDYQKTILQQYVFEASKEKLGETLGKLREETLTLIEKEIKENKKLSKAESDKYHNIQHALLEERSLFERNMHRINDNTIEFYMSVSKLNDELKD